MRSLPALYQDDDDGNDLSDLGLSTGKKSSVDGDDDGHRGGRGVSSTEDKCGREDEDVFRGAENPVAASAAAKTATVTTTAATAENGFDRAIKDYVDFAESKRTSVAVKCENPQQQQTRRKPLAAEMKRRMSAPKIEEKVMLLKTRSQSTKDLHSAAAAAELPKVDIGKRREIFEKAAAEIQQQPPQLAKKKPLETPPPVSVARTGGPQDIRRQVIEEISPPGSPPSPTGKNSLGVRSRGVPWGLIHEGISSVPAAFFDFKSLRDLSNSSLNTGYSLCCSILFISSIS